MFLGRGTSADAPGSTSSSLLDGVKAGEAEAWRRLARLYGPLVYRWCRRRGLQDSDAEDVVQEVFRAVIARIADFHRDRPGDSFRGWLWAITRNKLGDWIRRQKSETARARAAQLQRFLEELPADEPDDSEQAEEIGSLYQRALDSLRVEFTDRTWQAFWRVVVEGQGADTVAQDLTMSRNAVYVAKSRVLRRLRETLGEV
jgi:RNA polymerase sigma-70 factor, ECF subfamily